MRSARSRHRHRGGWAVRARVERFTEPSLLLLLRERPGVHGYELLDALADLMPAEQVDMGNLYRLLRALEEEGLVTSEWTDGKRRYELTPAGARLLADWASALERARDRIDKFLERYEKGGDDVPRSLRRPSR
jgi:PadR family transcriptional regulator PadR